VNPGHEDVLSVGRGIEPFIIPRLANEREGSGIGIDQGELGQRVIIEQVFVLFAVKGIASFAGAAQQR
jgi:hypothetical protein